MFSVPAREMQMTAASCGDTLLQQQQHQQQQQQQQFIRLHALSKQLAVISVFRESCAREIVSKEILGNWEWWGETIAARVSILLNPA